MFARFRQAHRLQFSPIETRRIAGKVKDEHVGSRDAQPGNGTVEAPNVEYGFGWRATR